MALVTCISDSYTVLIKNKEIFPLNDKNDKKEETNNANHIYGYIIKYFFKQT